MISASPGVMMRSCRILNLEPTPSRAFVGGAQAHSNDDFCQI
jgi:hypothetical protein